jgi:hypothetical protein
MGLSPRSNSPKIELFLAQCLVKFPTPFTIDEVSPRTQIDCVLGKKKSGQEDGPREVKGQLLESSARRDKDEFKLRRIF